MSEMATLTDPLSGRFVRGNNAYQIRKARRQALCAQLQLDYDFTRHMALLLVIADHLDAARHAKSSVDRTRSANAARRMLASVPHREGQTASTTLPEVLA